MKMSATPYSGFALVREMAETASVVRRFDHGQARPFAESIRRQKGLLLTGEGSSRIFPAKRMIAQALRAGLDLPIMTEGATQALEYPLQNLAVFGASNSGKTKEVVRLFMKLKEEGHEAVFCLTAHAASTLESLASGTHVLQCGKEDAVAATKSVVEQALFYDSLFRHLSGQPMSGLSQLADDLEQALSLEIDASLVQSLKQADTLYFAGRNTGVAEELALKTNEITRKKSGYLEGTYAVHGIEEVMDQNELVILVDPFESEEEKFEEVLVKGVGLKVIALAPRQTRFPTVVIPDAGAYAEYVQLAAGWNLLVETGVALGIDLDKPVRARKVGNEYTH